MDMFSQIYRAVSSRLPSLSSSAHTSSASRMNPKEIQEFVENNLKDNGLVVFIRTSPPCYFCQQALRFLQKYPELHGKSVDLSETGEQQAIISYLGSLPGSAPTFPRVFANKELIGGYSDLEGLGASGVKAIIQKV
ncbi:hypothetical protein DFJ58DRAFT_799354 [Suillus subalutaceus]|uniref:uncharacterized protein n=1 Tax=Suillus subalutaceus TaxID=48586 RepID=UPI001B869B4D|nr:uncharacterized protein DFJ58DRAFT_799354 [Suillus subalutaceus]KAG1846193.1 hypothetical protein DFJ58DRAFT_799354 [Suillus subalutaceus]KAG1871584.1 hypothetical protein F4604DRAFT_802977 [Suillus subluteus]